MKKDSIDLKPKLPDFKKIDYWTSKISKYNNTYDEARIVEQWSKDFKDRTDWAWDKIDKSLTEEDLENQTEEDLDKQVEEFHGYLTEEEKNEHEEIKKLVHRIMIEDEDIVHNCIIGIVRDKK